MFTITKVSKAMSGFFESIARARVNSVLLGMGREKVEEFGYSYDELRLGPDAWPWRKMPQKGTNETTNNCSDEKIAEHISKSIDDVSIDIRNPKSTSKFENSVTNLSSEIKKQVA